MFVESALDDDFSDCMKSASVYRGWVHTENSMWNEVKRKNLIMRQYTIFLVITVALGAIGYPSLETRAQTPVLESNQAIGDVETAFDRLRGQGEWLGANRKAGMPLSGFLLKTTRHYQGVARAPWHKDGDNRILYLTRSGDVEDSDNLGFLAVVQLGTRDQDGERFRSNLLEIGKETSATSPQPSDKVIKFIEFTDYQHPGGIQMVGDILAVPLEAPKEGLGLPDAVIRFFDCRDPENPVKLNYELEFDTNIGVIGITKMPDGHFLLLATGGDGLSVEFYRSNESSFFTSPTGAEDATFEFVFHDLWDADVHPSVYWPGGSGAPIPGFPELPIPAYQSTNFVNQKNTDGKLFLVGCTNLNFTAPFPNGVDAMYLYEVTGFEAGGTIGIDLASSAFGKRIVLKAYDEGVDREQFGNATAGGGVYVSPTGELLYYFVPHYEMPLNPLFTNPIYVRMAELRHELVTFDGTCGPQWRPNHLGGPFEIQEGETLALDGTVYVVQPWLDMFADDNFQGQAQMMDFQDQGLDDFEKFSALDGAGIKNGFNDKLSSFRACGPLNTSIPTFPFNSSFASFFKDNDLEPTEGLVNGFLLGTGEAQEQSSMVEGNDQASSAVIFNSTLGAGYAWDLDGDGAFDDFFGPIATFSAGVGGVGSSTTVRLRFDGVEAPPVTITVINAPPTIDRTSVSTNAFEGAAAEFAVWWSDLSSGEHTSTVKWGDGTQDVVIEDAMSGVVNLLHHYADDGDYVIHFEIDDGADKTTEDFDIKIANRPPSTDAGDPLITNEGTIVGLVNAAFNDPGTLDTHTATIDWDDGLVVTAGAVTEAPFGPPGSSTGMSGTVSASHVYADNGVYTVIVCVTDDDGDTDCDTTSINVMNVAPTVNTEPNQFINEGDIVALSPTGFNDKGTLDTHTASIDWDDTTVEAGVVTESPFGPPGDTLGLNGSVDGSHVFGDDGVYISTVSVTDKDGASNSSTFDIIVTNVAPVAVLDTTGATLFGGGEAFTGRIGVEQIHYAFGDDVGSDDLEFKWTAHDVIFGGDVEFGNTTYFNNGASPDPFQSSLGVFPFHADDSAYLTLALPGFYNIIVTVTDDDGGTHSQSLPKLVTGDARCVRTMARWRRQLNGKGRIDVDADTLLSYLSLIDFASVYFSEVVSVQTLEEAGIVLAVPMKRASVAPGRNPFARTFAVRGLLTAWLNVASGSVDLQEVLDNGLTALETLFLVEEVLLDPLSDKDDLRNARLELVFINRLGCRPKN